MGLDRYRASSADGPARDATMERARVPPLAGAEAVTPLYRTVAVSRNAQNARVRRGVMQRGELFRGPSEEARAAAITLVLDGQSPPFEGRWRERMRKPAWFASVEALLAARVDYFGPVARKPVRTGTGMGKRNVAPISNLVWLDLDPPADSPLIDQGVLLADAEQRLEGLRALA